jgi:hypothetical protein
MWQENHFIAFIENHDQYVERRFNPALTWKALLAHYFCFNEERNCSTDYHSL